MSDSDWLENLGTLAVGAYFVLSHLYRVVKAQKQRQIPAEDTEVVVPLPQQARPRPPVPLPLPSPTRQTDGRLDRLEARRARLVEDQARMVARAVDRGPREAVVTEVLTRTVAPELERLGTRIEAARGDAFAAATSFDELQYQLSHIATQLKVLSAALDLPPDVDSVMCDAEAIAEATMAPLQQFAHLHDVPLAPHRPICLPAGMVGGEATWIGLLGMGIPLIFVPDDFDEDLYRWPSIAHEVGHVLLHGVPGLLDEMGQAAGWTDRSDLLRVERGQIVGSPVQAWSAWREEIFADALTVLMLGPAALLGFEAVFARPENPAEVLQARAYRGRYAPHPPAHLRLHLSAFLLEELGFIQEGRAAVRSWNSLHGFPELADAEDDDAPSLVLPLADGRVVGMSVDGALARGTESMRRWLHTQYRGLAGHDVMGIPGFDLPPGHWARVRTIATQLASGTAPRADGRTLLAAAILAGSKDGAPLRTIAQAVQRAIVGRGEAPTRTATASRSAKDSGRTDARMLVEALLLSEILPRPTRGRRPARRSHRR